LAAGIEYKFCNGDIDMLGIQDRWVSLVFLLCVLSSVLCVVYGIFAWNRGAEDIGPEDKRWAAEEDKVEEKL
jgi:hypothetical protein